MADILRSVSFPTSNTNYMCGSSFYDSRTLYPSNYTPLIHNFQYPQVGFPSFYPNPSEKAINRPKRALGTKFKYSFDEETSQISKKQNTGSGFTLESFGIDPGMLSQLLNNLQQRKEEKVNSIEPQKTACGDVDYDLLKGCDEEGKVPIQSEKKIEEQKRLFEAKKLSLVLDLDHTVLHSICFHEVNSIVEEMLEKKEEEDRKKTQRHLFRLPHLKTWTKLRPGIWSFLEKVSKTYELHICTMGDQLYADEMAELLDPTGTLFGGRIHSKHGDRVKDLNGVLGLESTAIIMDDTAEVWPSHRRNLIQVDKYIYFPCKKLPGPSLLERDCDERPENGLLASSMTRLEKLHRAFYSASWYSLDQGDVRGILTEEKRDVLAGCRILFSGIFPMDEANPEKNPLWQMAQEFGAVCTTHMDSQVTHVVAKKNGTDKVRWAHTTGRFVVSPKWVQASAFLYQKTNENNFNVK